MQCVDLRAAGHDAIERVGEIGLRIDFVQFRRLCRAPNYAERFRNDAWLSRSYRLSRGRWLGTIRHSLGSERLQESE
jgi:hypothetical protein